MTYIKNKINKTAKLMIDKIENNRDLALLKNDIKYQKNKIGSFKMKSPKATQTALNLINLKPMAIKGSLLKYSNAIGSQTEVDLNIINDIDIEMDASGFKRFKHFIESISIFNEKNVDVDFDIYKINNNLFGLHYKDDRLNSNLPIKIKQKNKNFIKKYTQISNDFILNKGKICPIVKTSNNKNSKLIINGKTDGINLSLDNIFTDSVDIGNDSINANGYPHDYSFSSNIKVPSFHLKSSVTNISVVKSISCGKLFIKYHMVMTINGYEVSFTTLNEIQELTGIS